MDVARFVAEIDVAAGNASHSAEVRALGVGMMASLRAPPFKDRYFGVRASEARAAAAGDMVGHLLQAGVSLVAVVVAIVYVVRQRRRRAPPTPPR